MVTFTKGKRKPCLLASPGLIGVSPWVSATLFISTFLFFFFLSCPGAFCFHWGTGDELRNLTMAYVPWRNVHSNLNMYKRLLGLYFLSYRLSYKKVKTSLHLKWKVHKQNNSEFSLMVSANFFGTVIIKHHFTISGKKKNTTHFIDKTGLICKN